MEMYADGQLTIDRDVALHLWIKGPFFQGCHSRRRQLSMAARLENHHRDLSILRHQHPRLHPIIDDGTVERGWNPRPRGGFGNGPELLVLVERKAVNMHFRQLNDVFLMIAFMRGLIP